MSYARTALFYACAFAVNAVFAAPALPARSDNKAERRPLLGVAPVRPHPVVHTADDWECCVLFVYTVNEQNASFPVVRSGNDSLLDIGEGLLTGSKMVQEETIVVRRLPNAYFYPFSLWPLPKYQVRDNEDSHESFPYRRSYSIKRQNER